MADEGEHVAGDVASSEAFSCVSEEIFPLALKHSKFSGVMQGWNFVGNDFLPEIALKPSAPRSQGTRIVWRLISAVPTMGKEGTYEQRGFRRSQE